MRLRWIILAALTLAAALVGRAAAWTEDVLGAPFEMRYVNQPADYSGNVRCTVVRLQAPNSTGKAVLYVHGYNDYFFQREMAERFVAQGYDFYAVDLRKYGRSIMPGQTLFELRDISEYYADIDSALTIMTAEGGAREIVLMGHSTGGLTTSCYLARHPDPRVRALVLNSPFLDWNQSAMQEKMLIPMVRTFRKLAPRMKIPQNSDGAYAHSLHRAFGGEWDYNLDWKLELSPAVETSWLAAIDAAHDIVQNTPRINIPILLMHSDTTVTSGNRGDAVLDVEDIARYGRGLGVDVTEITVRGGLHDLALSARDIRDAMFDYLFAWLKENGF
ncbi:MAG: alpha/beta hydrolase [Muribaculaceae bacterium]|nr:alpha/beta hydrolase [Muribaculaceae bacterium]